ncbi:hypothetical protein RBU13_34780, partial [Pseudomonas aeruginosa]|nr:hypothetical protein [Pseudomonas aeruginosa]
ARSDRCHLRRRPGRPPARWQQLFARVFAASTAPAASIRIHDFGATPGVVRLRLEQALEEAGHD